MSLSDIFSDAIRYPFSNIVNYLFVGVLALLASLPNIVKAFNIDSSSVTVLSAILAIFFSIVLSGYCVTVIRMGIENSNDIPEIKLVDNLIDGIKVFIISLIYYIIPLMVILIFALMAGVIGAGLGALVAALGIFLIVAIILFVLFGIFEVVAIARFAKTGELSDALSIGEVIEDAKRIGIINIIAFILISMVIIAVAYIVSTILCIIPVIGAILSSLIVSGFVVLFYNKALGLLYSQY